MYKRQEEEIARFAVRRFEFPGVDIKTRLARYYPHGEMVVHALGHVGAISEADLEKIDRAQYSGTATIGKLGIELAYEGPLHGRNGSREILVNARGRSVEKQGSMTPQPVSYTHLRPVSVRAWIGRALIR